MLIGHVKSVWQMSGLYDKSLIFFRNSCRHDNSPERLTTFSLSVLQMMRHTNRLFHRIIIWI
jgi:hypothetical protein